MQQQALHQAGYDGYSEVIAQHKPYTFASAIIQMKSNLLLLLRALWQYPFGSGTLRSLSDDASLRSLSDMWQHYITRLSGNETYGIPSRLDQLTDLPSAPLLVADRKIECPQAIDGMGLWSIFGNKAMQDRIAANMYAGNDEGWVYDSTAFNNWFVMFAEAEDLIIPCGSATVNPLNNATLGNGTLKTKRIIFPFAKSFKNFSWHSGSGLTPMESATVWVNEFFDLIAPELLTAQGPYGIMGWGCPKLRKVWFPKYTAGVASLFYNNMQGVFDRLICLNVGELTTSTNMSGWTASMALRTDTTASDYVDLREEGSTATNNLEEFLSNFRTYIALRLADNGSGKTLTLSQAVYDAIKDESHLFVFDEGTMTIYAYLTNIKHWTVTK
jgi:hypothetical protein